MEKHIKLLAGPSAQNVLNKNDGRLYSSGHVFAKGMSEGNDITIGYSSASKVWSNKYDQIPIFINWCKKIASKIVSSKEVITNSAFDDIPKGNLITEFPCEVFVATWNNETYSNPPLINFSSNSGNYFDKQLLDFEILVVKEEIFNRERVLIDLVYKDLKICLAYNFNDFFQERNDTNSNFKLMFENQEVELINYLNEYPLTFYLVENFNMIMSHELHSPTKGDAIQFDINQVEPFPWTDYNADITKEIGSKFDSCTFKNLPS